MDAEQTEKQEEVPDSAAITASELSEQFRSGNYEMPSLPDRVEGSGGDDVSDEDAEAQAKAYEEGRGEFPESKKAAKRVFAMQQKSRAELEKKLSEQEERIKKMASGVDMLTLERRRGNLLRDYKARFIDDPEKGEKDFATPQEYRAYVSERDAYRAAYEKAIKGYTEQINAAADSESAGKGEESSRKFGFKSAADQERFVRLSAAYVEKVPEFAEAGKRWHELSAPALEAITSSPMAPALMHAAIDAIDRGGFAKLPESEQVRQILAFEAGIHSRLADLQKQQPEKSEGRPAKATPPPKIKGTGAPPKEDVITAADLAKQIREGKF